MHRFKRSYTTSISLVYDGATSHTTGAFVFALSDMPNYTEFTGLFDKYKITGIKAVFLPRITNVNHSDVTSTFTEVPPIYTAIDYDDATIPGSVTDLEQYNTFKVHWEVKPFSLYFKPQIAIAAYSGTFTSYASANNLWIDAASPGVQYYGLKWASGPYSTANNGNAPSWDVTFTYYISCKYSR